MVLISAFNGRQDTIDQLDKIGLDEIVLSAVTVMELFYINPYSNRKAIYAALYPSNNSSSVSSLRTSSW